MCHVGFGATSGLGRTCLIMFINALKYVYLFHSRKKIYTSSQTSTRLWHKENYNALGVEKTTAMQRERICCTLPGILSAMGWWARGRRACHNCLAPARPRDLLLQSTLTWQMGKKGTSGIGSSASNFFHGFTALSGAPQRNKSSFTWANWASGQCLGPRASFPGGHFVFWGRWDRHSLGWQIDPGTGFRGEKIRAMSWGN